MLITNTELISQARKMLFGVSFSYTAGNMFWCCWFTLWVFLFVRRIVKTAKDKEIENKRLHLAIDIGTAIFASVMLYISVQPVVNFYTYRQPCVGQIQIDRVDYQGAVPIGDRLLVTTGEFNVAIPENQLERRDSDTKYIVYYNVDTSEKGSKKPTYLGYLMYDEEVKPFLIDNGE